MLQIQSGFQLRIGCSVVLHTAPMSHATAARRSKSKADPKSTDVLRARCDSELKARVVAFADARGRKVSDLVREAVIEFLQQRRAA